MYVVRLLLHDTQGYLTGPAYRQRRSSYLRFTRSREGLKELITNIQPLPRKVLVVSSASFAMYDADLGTLGYVRMCRRSATGSLTGRFSQLLQVRTFVTDCFCRYQGSIPRLELLKDSP